MYLFGTVCRCDAGISQANRRHFSVERTLNMYPGTVLSQFLPSLAVSLSGSGLGEMLPSNVLYFT